MNFLRQHWFDLGLGVAALAGAWILIAQLAGLARLLWLSLITLCLHQFEEYRYPGYFPGMMNTVMFASRQPDRYPLNPQTALIVNTVVGWLTYFLAAVFAERALWLGLAAMLVSVGNFFAHTFLFNLRGRTLYNPGLLTAVVFFMPLSIAFYSAVIQAGAATPVDWGLGLLLGAGLNYVGILKLIDWLKDEHTPYIFPARCLLPSQRRQS